jgi:hypothetical protein
LQECESAAKSVQYLVTLVTPQGRHPYPRETLLDLGKRYIRQILYCISKGAVTWNVFRQRELRVTASLRDTRVDRDDESNRNVSGLGFMGLHLRAA